MPNELGFCAFCGSPDLDVARERERGIATFSGREFFYVTCDRCEAAGPTDYNRDKAIDKWKQRATEVDDEPRIVRGDYEE